MKLSTLFAINAIAALLFGLAFILVPMTMMSYYGFTLSDAGIFVTRLYGASLIAFAILSWRIRYSPFSKEVQAVLLSFFIGYALGFIISLIYQLQGVANALGWSTVLIYLLFTLGFAYFYFRK